MKEKVLFSWSGGKDSALALYEVQQAGRYEVVSLITTLSAENKRSFMNNVKVELLERQAQSMGLSIEKVFVSEKDSQKDYKSQMRKVLRRYLSKGVRTVVFGDIFLEDLRRQRQNNLAKLKMKAIFPLWKKDTNRLARTIIRLGFKTIITCTDRSILSGNFTGREFDESFLSELPSNIDACGENGEFHTFVYDGPIFHKKVHFTKGKVIIKDKNFHYCDLIE